MAVIAQAPGAAVDPAFEKAFAQRRRITVQQIALPTVLDGREVGAVTAQIRGPEVRYAREALVTVFEPVTNGTLVVAGYTVYEPQTTGGLVAVAFLIVFATQGGGLFASSGEDKPAPAKTSAPRAVTSCGISPGRGQPPSATIC